VVVEENVVGSIGRGMLILLGVSKGDTEDNADALVKKIVHLRIFPSENKPIDRSLLDIDGEALVVSQFTLCADLRKGRRPDFTAAAPPEEANRLYEYFVEAMRKADVRKVDTGVFGASMQVELVNQGPVTFVYEDKNE
jgi:D-tyrosyl-tRNA(Tyr) deacylase